MQVVLVVALGMLFMNTSLKMSLLLIVGGIVLFALQLIMRQESMLYSPCVMPGMQTPAQNPEGYRSPKERNLEFEDVHLVTSDDVKLHAWFIPVPGGKASTAPTVLFCHANAGNIGIRVPNFDSIVKELGANVFAFDYRGYGYSEGTPSEEGLIEDALTAWEWLGEASKAGKLDMDKVFIFGRSLGGAVAVALCCALQRRNDKRLPCGILLENTFVSISKLVDALFPIIAYKVLKDRFLRIKWETIERIKEVQAPLLFLTGLKDEMIAPQHSKDLLAAAVKSPLRRKADFEDGGHNDTWEKGGSAYWERQADFIKECLESNFSKTD